MKNFLFIFTLLLGLVLFLPEEESKAADQPVAARTETVMKENSASDSQQKLEIIRNELKESKGLTSRRTVQTVNPTVNFRFQKSVEKLLQLLRLKEENSLRKISEEVSLRQTIHLSTLLCRKGYHVYALRKILI